jgi:hypothetical protein
MGFTTAILTTPRQLPPAATAIATATATATLPFTIEQSPGHRWALPAVNGNIPQAPAFNDGSPQADGNGPTEPAAGLNRIASIVSSEHGPGTLGRFEELPDEMLELLWRELPLSTLKATVGLSRGMLAQTEEIAAEKIWLERQDLLARASTVDTLAEMQEVLGDGEFRKICRDLGDAFGGRLLAVLGDRIYKMRRSHSHESLEFFELFLKAAESLPDKHLEAALLPNNRSMNVLERLTIIFGRAIKSSRTDRQFSAGTGLRWLELVKKVPKIFHDLPLQRLAAKAHYCKNEALEMYDAVLNEILSLSPGRQAVPLENLAESTEVLRKTGVSASELRIKEIVEVVREIHADIPDSRLLRRWNTLGNGVT